MMPYLQFGYVAHLHGLHGEVAVRTFDLASNVFNEVKRVFARFCNGVERELKILSVRQGAGRKKKLLVRFHDVDDPNALIGATLFAFREDLKPPGDTEVFQGDLLDLQVFSPDGRPLGRVESIYAAGPVPNLVIRDGHKEWMVPLVEDFVRQVDLSTSQIVLQSFELED